MSLGWFLVLISAAPYSDRAILFRVVGERLYAPSARAQSSAAFREAFRAGWKDRWMEKALHRR
jgi:hypothetical protein